MKCNASQLTMKLSAVSLVALGFLLTGFLETFAADEAVGTEKPAVTEAPAPAAAEPSQSVAQPTVSAPAAEKPAVTAALAAAEQPATGAQPSPTNAPSAPAPAEPAAAVPSAPAAPVAPAPAEGGGEKPAAPATAVTAPVESVTPAEPTAPAAVPSVPAPAEPAAAAPAAPAAPAPAEPTAVAPSVVAPAPEAESKGQAPAPESSVISGTSAVPSVAPAAQPAVAAEKASGPSAEKGPEFELDRGSVSGVTGETAAAAEQAEAAPQPKPSFWSRLFGSKKGAAEKAEKPSAALAEQAATNAIMSPEEMVAAQEEVRRQAKEVEGLKALDEAYQAMARNDFAAALKSFNQAMNVMPVRPHTLETRQKAMQSQAECEYRIALNYYKEGKNQEAKEAIRRALGYNPMHQRSMSLSERIKKDEAQAIETAAKPVPIRYTPDHLNRVKQIRESIDRGRQYYAIREYENARREFKNVLVIDEKNEEAAAWLEKVHDKLYAIETDQMNRQQADMISQVRDTWTPPVKRETAGPEVKIPDSTITDVSKRRLLAKLNGIVIPQLEFRQANIVDVIKYLDQVSIANDKDSAPGDKGVNFILQLKRPGETTEAAAPAAAEGLVTEETAAMTPSTVPSVTLSLRNIVLMDAIKYITEVTGLKYRIEESVVVITPSDVVYGTLITKTFKVQPSIAETIMGGTAAGGGTAAMGTAGTTLELGAGMTTAQRGDVRKFFIDAGVPFPEGTSIVYKPSLNLLIVKNTADNMENFERILNSLNVVPVQVEIEARFVEVSQQDLEELGIEWLLTDNWEIAENAGPNASIPVASRERIQVNQGPFTKGLRNFASSASGVITQPSGNLGNILSISGVLTNPELTMVLHALEQKTGANLLSAPKVTTKSGANAEIKVVEELIYPTEFDLQTPAAAGTTGSSVIPMSFVQPGGFQTRDTGVILNVTPTVGPDGFSIDLVMLPQVCELTSWIDYGTDYPNPSGVGTYHMPMPQPIFKSRNITTGITIWDGQTVVMGGLISEKQSTTLDKVPILGDVPLLGYLFQSKTSNSQKFNLLIFVTANLVDPAGNKINKELIATASGTSASSSAPTATTP